MATMPSPARPVASSTSEAGSGTAAGGTLAFAVAGKSIPSTIQYTDFINPPYYFRRRMMATIPSPAKPVARSTREAGSVVFDVAPHLELSCAVRVMSFLTKDAAWIS